MRMCKKKENLRYGIFNKDITLPSFIFHFSTHFILQCSLIASFTMAILFCTLIILRMYDVYNVVMA